MPGSDGFEHDHLHHLASALYSYLNDLESDRQVCIRHASTTEIDAQASGELRITKRYRCPGDIFASTLDGHLEHTSGAGMVPKDHTAGEDHVVLQKRGYFLEDDRVYLFQVHLNRLGNVTARP
jgi:hypothetical protein